VNFHSLAARNGAGDAIDRAIHIAQEERIEQVRE
jgi:hypothetical protein